MEYLSKLTGVLARLKGVMKPTAQSTTVVATTSGIRTARYTARLAILLMALFIFMWWPVDQYDPTGFDAWSTRMTNLPKEVWYVLLSVILSWGTTEVMASRAINNSAQSANDTYIDDTYLSDATTGFDGQLENVSSGDDFIPPTGPNPVIEDWQQNNEAQ